MLYEVETDAPPATVWKTCTDSESGKIQVQAFSAAACFDADRQQD